MILKPDYNIVAKQNQEEFNKLYNIKLSLDEAASDKIIKDSIELNKHQNQLQDPNILPCISINDIPSEIEKVDCEIHKIAHSI